MAIEAVAPIGELALYALAAVAELSVYVVVASLRPWHYVLSSSYRRAFDAQYENRRPIFKWLALIGGVIMLAASAAIIYCVITFILSIREAASEKHPTLKERAVSSAASAATHLIKGKTASSP